MTYEKPQVQEKLSLEKFREAIKFLKDADKNQTPELRDIADPSELTEEDLELYEGIMKYQEQKINLDQARVIVEKHQASIKGSGSQSRGSFFTFITRKYLKDIATAELLALRDSVRHTK